MSTGRDPSALGHFALVSAGQRFILEALPLESSKPQEALSVFMQTVRACALPNRNSMQSWSGVSRASIVTLVDAGRRS